MEEKISPKDTSALGEQMLVVKVTHAMQQDERSPSQVTHQGQAVFDMNAVIGWILQFGVVISSAVICAGVILALVQDQFASKNVLIFPHSLVEVWSGLLALRPSAIIALGLLLLLATPVVRVTASIVAFGLERDRRYVAITTLVLAILVISFLLGKGAG